MFDYECLVRDFFIVCIIIFYVLSKRFNEKKKNVYILCVFVVIDRNWIGLIFIFYDFANYRWDWTIFKLKRSTNWNNDFNRNWSCWWYIRVNLRCRWRYSIRGNVRSWRRGCYYGGFFSSKRLGLYWLTGVFGLDMNF